MILPKKEVGKEVHFFKFFELEASNWSQIIEIRSDKNT